MERRLPIIAIVLFVIAGSAALAMAVRPGSDTVTLRWPHIYEINSPYHREAVWAAGEFERRTGGRYEIEIYPASSLGGEVAITEALNIGSIDILYVGPSVAARSYPRLALSEYPFAIEDYDHWKAYRDSALFADIKSGYQAATGHTIFGFVYYGFRHVTSNRPILHPDDMRDLKIRVPNAPLYLIMPRLTGANATPMPFSEVYLALQLGTVDAQENPLVTIQFMRFYEVQSHINLTAHMSNSILTVVSQRTLDRLAAQDAEILADVLYESAARASDAVDGEEQVLADWFRQQGISVNEVDRDAFKTVVAPALTADDTPYSPEDFTRLQALAEDP